MKKQQILMGYPKNSRLERACNPIRDALDLTEDSGTFQSPYLPGVSIRPRRVSDMARFIRRGIFSIGILGDDSAFEAGLEYPLTDNRDETRVLALGPKTVDPRILFPSNKIATLKKLNIPTWLTLMIREEEFDQFPDIRSLLSTGTIVTSFPTSCMKVFNMRGQFMPADGQIESMVRNQDIPSTVGGVDIVKTGETMKKFRLLPYSTIMESNPGIWKSPRIPEDMENQITDTISVLKERLSPYIS